MYRKMYNEPQENIIRSRLQFPLVAAFFPLLIFTSTVSALDPQKAITQYIHQIWTSDEGLPENAVLSILQTRDGYLWLATEEGLTRFDGVRFAVYDKNNTSELKANRITALREDFEGNLWIGTDGGGFSRFRNGKFSAYTSTQGLVDDHVLSLCADRDGSLWIGTSKGLSRFRDGKFTNYTTKQGLSDDTVWSVYQDSKGNLWTATSGGLTRFRDGKFTSYTIKDGLSNNYVISICESRDGTLWIGTSRGGLDRFRDGKFTAYTAKDGLTNEIIITVYEDRAANLWIGTSGGGLNRFRDGKFSAYTTSDGLSHNIVVSIYEDREGSLWVGTYGGGLDRFQDGKFTTFSVQEGLSNNDVRSIYQDRDGAIWMGTFGGGLNRLQDGKITSYTTKEGLLSDKVRSIFQDRDGSLWIATSGGLNHLKEGKLTAFTTEKGFSNNNLWAVIQDFDGSLWTGSAGGLNHFHDGKFSTYTTKDGLIDDNVWSLYEESDGTLWIGTVSGLSRFSKGKFTSYTTRQGLSTGTILTLYKDREGSLWIGTEGGGVSRLKNGKFTSYTTQNGLFNDVVYEILEDSKGSLWMTCDKGIFRINKKEFDDFDAGKLKSLHFVSFGKADGMKSQECNGGSQPAGIKAADGKFWFPTVKGSAVIDPENIKINQLAPPVIVENVIADGKTISGEQGLQMVSPYVIEPGNGKFEFHYTGLSLLVPEKVKFKCKLEGLDQDWVDTGSRRIAYYTNVRPGNYTFRVQACNNDGIWNQKDASFSFILKPHFYQTLWFYVFCGLSLILIGWNLNRYRLHRVIEMERIRARIAADLHDDIGSGLSQISILTEVARKNPDDSERADQLMKIANTSRELLDSMSDIVWAVNPNRDHMTDLIHRIRRFASDVLSARNIEFGFSVADIETDARLNPDFRRDIYLIFKESVNNIIRHAECTRVDISLGMDGRVFVMKVSDNGEGYSPSASSDGHGLESMRERATKLGGAFVISTTKGTGTVVTLRIPVG